MTFTFGREERIGRWLREKPKSFLDWEKIEGVLTPELCNQHKQEEGTPMLLNQATVKNVSRALNEINGFDWEGDFKPMALQALKDLVQKQLEEDMAEYLGLSRYERALDRPDYRNGHYVRHLLTEMGDLELLVPRSRKGGFPTKLFERYARRCRSVDKVSASTISRIARDLDREVKLYHGREIGDRYRYLFFDGVVLKSKGALKVQKKILLCAFGITVEGHHEMIDFYPAATESAACWEAFLADLYKRG